MTHNWETGPILRAMSRNKVGALLIALQIAITMTIIINAIFIIVERSALMGRESGVDEANTFYLTSTGFGSAFNASSVIDEDLRRLRGTPGVVDAVQINAIPISGGGWSMSLKTETGADIDGIGTANYFVDEHGVDALDLQVIAGENFTASDVRLRGRNQSDWPPVAMITRALAENLFPDTNYADVVGKTVYIGNDEPVTVTGIIDKLQAPWIGWDRLEHAMLTPEKMDFSSTRYLIRTEPGQRDRLMAEVETALADAYPNRIIRDVDTLTATRERSYRRHSAMITILTAVMVLLCTITALGIVGLTSFNVSRRRKQIGTRRALGATKPAIIRYFMLENLMICTLGIVLGSALTVGLNMALVQWFNQTALDWFYIPAGIGVLILIGQLAVLGPALRAAQTPPALATRTV
ncbi:ABC transporter permease [Alteromonas halophila]|uniref:ABC transporter permease n=1 Tax=Alteromonas halophila TaxID=516698 RepID=A0A918JPU0_9ALTE|nr:FtsX-like permease family protein [Alteromonas halophila]GGW91267.1 ABC transporter permease [Alteromonas halophila]